MGLVLDGTTDYLTTASMPVSAYPFSASIWARGNSAASGDSLMWMGDNAASNQYWRMDQNTTTSIRTGSASGGTTNNAVTTAGPTNLVWFHAGCTMAAANSRRILLNGGNGATAGTSRAFPTNADQLAIGMNRDSAAAGDYVGTVALAAIWNVALSDAEHAALASGASPLMVRPGNLVGFWPMSDLSQLGDFNPSGGTKRPLTANGNVATGMGPRLAVPGFGWGEEEGLVGSTLTNYELDAQPGSFIVTGAVAGLLADRVLNAASGSFALTGAVAALNRGYNLDAQPGTYAITGAAATLLADRMINAAPGAYSVTGVETRFDIGMGLSAGSYTVTGAQAALLADRLIDASPGAYALTGVAVSFDIGFGLGPGSFIITGFEVTGDGWSVAYELNAEPGTFAISGAPAGLLADRLINAAPGSISVTGHAASLLADRSLDASAGAFSITGTAAGLLVARQIAAMPGEFTIEGFDAFLQNQGQPQLPASARAIVVLLPTGQITTLVPSPEIVKVFAEGELNEIDTDGEIVVIDAEGAVWRL